MYTVDPAIYKGDQLNIRINKTEKQELRKFMKANNVGLLQLIRIGIETIKKES